MSSQRQRQARPVAVLSGAVAIVGRQEQGDSRAAFAARASVSVNLIGQLEDGSRAAWDVPAPEVFQIAAAYRPETADLFWGAGLADLLMQEVSQGDYASAAATAACLLGDPEDTDKGRMLLLLAVRGGRLFTSELEWSPTGPLLPEEMRRQLRDQAQKLAESTDEAAWVGRYLLSLFPADMGEAGTVPFGTALRNMRLGRGLSLRSLGRLINYDWGYVGQVERGTRGGSAQFARLADRALNANGMLKAAFVDGTPLGAAS